MPDLGTLLNPCSSSSTLEIPCPNFKPPDQCESSTSPVPDSVKTLDTNHNCSDWEQRLRFPIHSPKKLRALKRCRSKNTNKTTTTSGQEDKSPDEISVGVSGQQCVLPFLGARKLVECRICQKIVHPGTEISCSARGCEAAYHLICAEQRLGVSSSRKFKCPQHACFLCKQKFQLLRCVRCELAWHAKCAAFPEHVMHLHEPGQAICWKHPTDWHQDNKLAVPINSIEEVFCRLPLPYVPEEFDIDRTWKDTIETEMEPPPYVHIKRSIYLVKKKKCDAGDADIGCTNCISSDCSENCVCRVQCISCSKSCRCSGTCNNRPFRKEKKIEVVKTEHCGWGVVAAESINKGDFVIEYVGEVISDAMCEQRFWDMKHMGTQNFYLCEVQKDLTIDATFKGNTSRFLNHSCYPNCNLEKWQLDGETRIGVFAARSIQAGEPLTYDYRFIQFGAEVKCQCGAPNCRGYLGAKRKTSKVEELRDWGLKGKRTSTAFLAIIKL
ncbi:Histone-lysine N-methyltransferase ASHR3 [Heracleum sosnowskyi]|uniref:Histone-lysine N-methyltransferase ASHR3 n=1 Tax=Heracleum sosnowskyi TaxID=360622 RepID=A0AAD8JJ68_9APIA|nr:Histone-lysine N-methyltransferase ASHR3 [Heracleum sosnowskyi]